MSVQLLPWIFPRQFDGVLSSGSKIKIRACKLAEIILGLGIELKSHKSPSRVSRQPRGYEEMLEGALNRAAAALAAFGKAWLAISIENGEEDILGMPHDIPCVVIRCRNQAVAEALGLPFPIPLWLWERVMKNDSEIGDEVPSKDHDPMAHFTNNEMDRAEICAWAVVMCFLPLIYSERYTRPVAVARSQEEIDAFMASRMFTLPPYDPALEDIAFGSTSNLKLEAQYELLTEQNALANIVPFKVDPLYTVQPVGYASIHQECQHRAMTALAQYVAQKGKMPLYAIGVQTGVVVRRQIPYEIMCTVMISREGYTTVSWGMPIRIPEWLWHEYLDGAKLQNGEAWEIGRRIAELDPLCLHNTLLYLSGGQIKDTKGNPLGRTFLLWQVLKLAWLQHKHKDRYLTVA